MLTYEPLDVQQAVGYLAADVDKSPLSIRDYIMNHRLSYCRLTASRTLGYVATVYGMAHNKYEGDNSIEHAFYDGAVMGLRSIFMTKAAIIGLRMALSDVDPLAQLTDPDDDKSFAAQKQVITMRAARGLAEPAVAFLPLEYWTEAATGTTSEPYFSDGFGYTLESARLAALQRLGNVVDGATA